MGNAKRANNYTKVLDRQDITSDGVGDGDGA